MRQRNREKEMGEKASGTELQRRRSIEDFATVEAECDGHRVYAFGYTYVLSVSPDFITDLSWQENGHESRKLVPKKSWEIKNNLLGSTPAREPKSLRIDDQPLLPVHLIDGDPETCWCSRGQIKADVEPVWIRIDLPMETSIASVRLVPSRKGLVGLAPVAWEGMGHLPVGQGLPKKLTLKLSRDGHHWDTFHEIGGLSPTPDMDPIEIAFEPRRAKQVWIIGEEFPEVLSLGHCFSIASVEILSSGGENLALHSRGAGVTVSSTHLGYGMDRFTQDMLWPIQYDLGFKWTRVGYDMSAFQWAYVEREKGVFEVDPRADAAVTDAVEHGMEVVMVLDKGNWLHAPEPRQVPRNRDLIETYFNSPPWPDPDEHPDYFEAWLRYVRFMVRHFKDRVRYFEIWNEWNINVPPEKRKEQTDHYCRLAEPSARAIREEYPGARIISASTSSLDEEFIETCAARLKGLIDVAGFHPYYNNDPREIREYPGRIASLRERLGKHGFSGGFMATEWSWFASYPAAARDKLYFTEMQKAKIAARFMTANAGLGIPSFWNETFQTQMTSRDVSLLRNTFSSNPINAAQPQPVYYALRTLSTALADVEPEEWTAGFSSAHEDIECWTFRRSEGDELILAVWLAGEAADNASREHMTNILLDGRKAISARGIDSLNGNEFGLRLSEDGGSIPGVRIRDWPLVIAVKTK